MVRHDRYDVPAGDILLSCDELYEKHDLPAEVMLTTRTMTGGGDELYVKHDLPADSFVVLDGYKMQVCISGRIPILPLRPLLDNTRLPIAMLSDVFFYKPRVRWLHLLRRGLGYNLLPTANYELQLGVLHMLVVSQHAGSPHAGCINHGYGCIPTMATLEEQGLQVGTTTVTLISKECPSCTALHLQARAPPALPDPVPFPVFH
eukprot:GHVR01165664.1.p1 GENE.GHVR01165664.1~~GHVR01165664.1.p1  ORF type:complete len:204 (-),score=20.96 GHVR01165664.1:516-1127(-)